MQTMVTLTRVACAGLSLLISAVPLPVARDHPVGNTGMPQSINRLSTMGPQSLAEGCNHHCEGRYNPCTFSLFLGWAWARV